MFAFCCFEYTTPYLLLTNGSLGNHAVDGSSYVNTWVSNGHSTFSVGAFSPWAGYAVTNGLWRAGDFNGDGKTDIVHVVQDSSYANIWLAALLQRPCRG